MNSYTKLEWWNACDLDLILFQEGFKNWLYLDCEPSLPEYEIQADVVRDGFGANVNASQRLTKRLEMQFVAPEFLLDSVTLIPLCSNVWIYTKDGGAYQLSDVSIEIEWLDGDCLALCTLSFLADTLDKKNCCENLSRCLELTLGDVVDVVQITDAIYTDPVGEGIAEGSIYFFWSVSANNGYTLTGNVYTLSIGQWVSTLATEGDVFNNETDGINWYFDGAVWRAYPHITLDVSSYPNTIIYAFMPANTWGILYEDTGGGWTPLGQYTAVEMANGVAYVVTDLVVYDFKMTSLNHSCNYGETQVATIDLPCDYEFLLNYTFDNGTQGVEGNVQDWTTFKYSIITSIGNRFAQSIRANDYINQTLYLSDRYWYLLRFSIYGSGAGKNRTYSLTDGTNFLVVPYNWVYDGIGTKSLNETGTWSLADTQNAIPDLTGFTPPYGATGLATIAFKPPATGNYTIEINTPVASTVIGYISIERDCL